MAKISQILIQERNKERCNIFIDDEFKFALSLEIVLKYRLKVGMELSDMEIDEITSDSQKVEALNKALTYVSKSLKTKRQVKLYLLRKGYSEQVAYFVIDKLKEYSYVNDVDYARQYIESCSKNQGKKLIAYKLMAKGISKEDIDLAYSMVNVQHKENAKSVLEKYLRNKEITKENLAKAYRYLLGKGFSYDEIDFALNNFKEN